ncbi:MAG: EAL domain-containing protein, partial [Verrucomicrobiota bacterium]
WVRSNISPVTDTTGKITHFVAIQEDITLDKLHADGVERQATYDYLTGLPNRMLAFDRLEHALTHMAREHTQIAVFVLDLDNFKHINDSLGHLAGDQLLVQVGVRLTALLRADDTVARLGGDEFLVILPSIRNALDAEAIAAKIVTAFSVPFFLLPQEMFCTISIGISVAPDDGVDPHDLLRNADTALYVAKAEGRNTHRNFVERMNVRANERMTTVTCLRHALERTELFLVYQPLVDIGSGTVVGAEALMRWSSPELGVVGPSRFIPLAEELGLIVPFGQWLLSEVCQQIQSWQAAGLSVPRIAVNVSSRQLREAGFASHVMKHLTDSGVRVDQIEFEITEGILIGECAQTAANMRDLRQAGIVFSVDDFGTGFSSLSYLQRFPLSSLKIDRSFVTELPSHADSAILTKAIISMAQQLRMSVVAEGVETPEQLEFLRQAGCDIAQGYLFSRPVPSDRFEQTIRMIERLPKGISSHPKEGTTASGFTEGFGI